MNSLTELNGYVNSFTLPYTDERLPDVIFDRATPVNQTQSVDRGFTVSGSVGIDILEILNFPLSNPTYTIDVTALPGATVSYASLPPGVSLLNPSTGVYVITGFEDKAQWDLIKSPTIDFSDDFFGSFTYTSTISYYSYYTGAQTRTWTTAVTVNNILFWTNATQFIYSLSAVSNIVGVPIIGNVDATYPAATWTVTVTPSSISSINTFTTTGTGGTFSVDGSTKVITIIGTRAQVNSRLQGLQIDANAISVDFVLTYFASNSINAVTDTRTQTLVSQGLAVLGVVSQPTIYYIEDTNFTITGAPLITDTSYDGTGTYSYTITPSDVAAIQTATIGGSGGTATFNGSTKVITISGTRSQVNGRLNSITITPAVDYALNFNLQYFCSTPRADTANKIQVAAIGSNDTEVTNMNINRSYTANNANSIFASTTPFISDFDESNPTYTVIFDCAIGQWTSPITPSPYVEGPLSNPISITGTKAFINARFSQIKFYPNQGVSANSTFTYTQIKNGVTQVTQTVALLGSAGTYNGARIVEFTNSLSYTPPVADVRYGKIDKILMIGGGGGGGGGGIFSGQYWGGGGGGGGGVRYSTNDIIFAANTAYDIILGAGGLGGTPGATGQTTPATNGGAGGTTSAFGLSIAGGGGGGTNGTGGTSGPQVGGIGDHGGKAGGVQSTTNNSLGGRNAGGGGGHPSAANATTGIGSNGTTTQGGSGASGSDEPDGANSFWAAGGGGGGNPTRGSAGNASTSGAGASLTQLAAVGVANKGGGGGGGFGSNPGAAGGTGYVKIWIVSQ